MMINVMAIKIKDRVAANPQLSNLVTWLSISIAIIMSLRPPTRAGVIKKAIDKIKTNVNPAIMPGVLNGRNIRQNVRKGPAPKMFDAFNRLRSIPFMVAYKGKIIKGTSI